MRKEELTAIALFGAVFLSGCSTQPKPAFASSANEHKVLRTNLPADYHLMQRASLSFFHYVGRRYLEQA